MQLSEVEGTAYDRVIRKGQILYFCSHHRRVFSTGNQYPEIIYSRCVDAAHLELFGIIIANLQGGGGD